jgi:hypothetical protein
VTEHLGVRAARLLQGVTQDRHDVEGPFVVGGRRQGDDVGRQPGRMNGRRAEGVEDVVEQVGLRMTLPRRRGMGDRGRPLDVGPLGKRFPEEYGLPGGDPGGFHAPFDDREGSPEGRPRD